MPAWIPKVRKTMAFCESESWESQCHAEESLTRRGEACEFPKPEFFSASRFTGESAGRPMCCRETSKVLLQI